MFKEKWNEFKLKIQKPKEGKEEKTKQKKLENVVVFIIVLIITIIAINMIWKDNKKESNNTKQNTIGKTLASTNENKEIETTASIITSLEQRLENMLVNMQGVGKTKVLITYSQSSQTVAMYNEDSTQSDTNEEDSRRRKQKSTANYD